MVFVSVQKFRISYFWLASRRSWFSLARSFYYFYLNMVVEGYLISVLHYSFIQYQNRARLTSNYQYHHHGFWFIIKVQYSCQKPYRSFREKSERAQTFLFDDKSPQPGCRPTSIWCCGPTQNPDLRDVVCCFCSFVPCCAFGSVFLGVLYRHFSGLFSVYRGIYLATTVIHGMFRMVIGHSGTTCYRGTQPYGNDWHFLDVK